MRIGYARVSTDGQSIDLQTDALQRFGCQVIFKDEGQSGARRSRPGLEQCLAQLAVGDDLVVWKLDRLGRSLPHLIEVVNELDRRRIGLVSLSEAINTTSPGGVLIFHIMAALAQFERALISERTKAGMLSARMRGRHVGRPRKLDDGHLAAAITDFDGKPGGIASAALRLGVSRATVYRALKRVHCA
jgi:DNA invertase Pin-like site-specific DNA recombinase